jgi:ketopantoate hydroxymethyltransferase
MKDIQSILKLQLAKRYNNLSIPAIKVNLYNSVEVRAVRQAIDRLGGYKNFTIPDCFMVGDSLLTTHLGQKSTHLETIEAQDDFIDHMLASIEDVRSAINENFLDEERPYLMGDIPDGSTSSDKRLLKVSEKMLQSGADIIKLEIASRKDLYLIELLTKNKIPVAAHVGYNPQKNTNRQYGQTLEEAIELIELVRLASDRGASAIIVERIAEVVNRVLSTPAENALPVYSIFSGKAVGGGQSLNVWDAVYKPKFKSYFFPPTAQLHTETYPYSYTQDTIADCFFHLLKLTLDGNYPKSPSSFLSPEEIMHIESLCPWAN